MAIYWIKTASGIERFKHGMVVSGWARPLGWPDALTAEELAVHGVLIEVRGPMPTLGANEKYGPEEKHEVDGEYRITRTVVPMTVEDLERVKEQKVSELSAACEAQIIAGFESSVLGTPHRYQSDRDDQLNLVGMAATGADCFVKCSADGGIWEYKSHTSANMQQLLNEASSLKHGLLEKFLALKNTVLQAATGDEVSAVVW